MQTSSNAGGLVILCEGLKKRYRIGSRERYRALRDVLTDALRTPFRSASRIVGRKNADVDAQQFLWALNGIDLHVRQGEILGIIGRNGAGKSTLLKILSRITKPTIGYARTAGHVGSLLEVGTGFHSELTGRENIYLNGAILGMKRATIRQKFDEIVAFSECERLLDTPVKHYSSGMYMRLAFAVAAHLEPDILLVDEVLAVGDVAFQKKCLGKMNNVATEGRTVLFVSHNMVAVQSLCTRAICMHQGRITADGAAGEVVAEYLQQSVPDRTEVRYDHLPEAPGNEKVRVNYAGVRPRCGSIPGTITVRTPLVIEFRYWNLVPDVRLDVVLDVENHHGITVFSTGTVNDHPASRGLMRSTCAVPGDLLNDGMHRIRLSFVHETGPIYQMEDVLAFNVLDDPYQRGGWHGQWPGAVRPHLKWETEMLAGEAGDNCGPRSSEPMLRR